MLDWPQDTKGQIHDSDGKTYADDAVSQGRTPDQDEDAGDMGGPDDEGLGGAEAEGGGDEEEGEGQGEHEGEAEEVGRQPGGAEGEGGAEEPGQIDERGGDALFVLDEAERDPQGARPDEQEGHTDADPGDR